MDAAADDVTPDEPTPACPCCHRPNSDRTWRVCDNDTTKVLQWLDEIVELHAIVRAEPLAYLVPATSSGDAPLGGTREPPPPCDIDALDLLTGESLLRGLDAEHMGLEDWAVDWRHWLGASGHGQATERDRSPADTLVTVVGYLRANWPLMARSAADGGHPAVDEFYSDLRKARGHAWSALRLQPSDLDESIDPPPDYTIECPTDDCGYRIPMTRQPRPVDGEKPAEVVVNCPRCGAHRSASQLLLIAQMAGTQVEFSVEEVMAHYGVSKPTVYRMVARGELRRGKYGRLKLGSGQSA